MNKKSAVLKLFVFVLLGIMIFSGCDTNKSRLQRALEPYTNLLESNRTDHLTLEIYYMDPSILTCKPVSIDDLIHSSSTHTIVIDNEELMAHIDSFKQINAENLVPVKNPPNSINTRLCYIVTDAGNEVLVVAFGGENNSVFVNGIEVTYNDMLYDAIRPFLEADETWQSYLTRADEIWY